MPTPKRVGTDGMAHAMLSTKVPRKEEDMEIDFIDDLTEDDYKQIDLLAQVTGHKVSGGSAETIAMPIAIPVSARDVGASVQRSAAMSPVTTTLIRQQSVSDVRAIEGGLPMFPNDAMSTKLQDELNKLRDETELVKTAGFAKDGEISYLRNKLKRSEEENSGLKLSLLKEKEQLNQVGEKMKQDHQRELERLQTEFLFKQRELQNQNQESRRRSTNQDSMVKMDSEKHPIPETKTVSNNNPMAIIFQPPLPKCNFERLNAFRDSCKEKIRCSDHLQAFDQHIQLLLSSPSEVCHVHGLLSNGSTLLLAQLEMSSSASSPSLPDATSFSSLSFTFYFVAQSLYLLCCSLEHMRSQVWTRRHQGILDAFAIYVNKVHHQLSEPMSLDIVNAIISICHFLDVASFLQSSSVWKSQIPRIIPLETIFYLLDMECSVSWCQSLVDMVARCSYDTEFTKTAILTDHTVSEKSRTHTIIASSFGYCTLVERMACLWQTLPCRKNLPLHHSVLQTLHLIAIQEEGANYQFIKSRYIFSHLIKLLPVYINDLDEDGVEFVKASVSFLHFVLVTNVPSFALKSSEADTWLQEALRERSTFSSVDLNDIDIVDILPWTLGDVHSRHVYVNVFFHLMTLGLKSSLDGQFQDKVKDLLLLMMTPLDDELLFGSLSTQGSSQAMQTT